MDIKEKAENIKDYIIEMRRHFHQNPELSLEEFETTKKIVNELEKMGIEVNKRGYFNFQNTIVE